MHASRVIPIPLVTAALVVALVGCNPGSPNPAPSATTKPAASATPTPTPTGSPAQADPLPEDVVMVVDAVATADNGAVLDLSLTVHRSTAWDDPAGADRAALMTQVCAGSLEDSVYEQGLFSFAKIDFAAVQRPGAQWPANHRLFLTPNSTYTVVAADGFPLDDDEVDNATPRCLRGKYFEGPGTGTVVVGFRGDTDDAGAAGGFTKWANHNYGFTAVRVAGQTAESVGMALSDCHYLVTAAGEALNGDAAWWGSLVNDTHCVYGSLTEDDDR
ncbi:hypothetical protein BH09ACT5_BH09ACT5_20050 [soil metagenome]